MSALMAKLPHCLKIAWAVLVVFALVGNCAGHHDGAVAIAVITSVVWVCSRIISEAIEAYGALTKKD